MDRRLELVLEQINKELEKLIQMKEKETNPEKIEEYNDLIRKLEEIKNRKLEEVQNMITELYIKYFERIQKEEKAKEDLYILDEEYEKTPKIIIGNGMKVNVEQSLVGIEKLISALSTINNISR